MMLDFVRIAPNRLIEGQRVSIFALRIIRTMPSPPHLGGLSHRLVLLRGRELAAMYQTCTQRVEAFTSELLSLQAGAGVTARNVSNFAGVSSRPLDGDGLTAWDAAPVVLKDLAQVVRRTPRKHSADGRILPSR